jgi:hypothetical protein
MYGTNNIKKYKIVCTFDKHSPKIRVFQIHEWLHDCLQIEEHEINTIQIDGPEREVFVKYN